MKLVDAIVEAVTDYKTVAYNLKRAQENLHVCAESDVDSYEEVLNIWIKRSEAATNRLYDLVGPQWIDWMTEEVDEV